LKALVKKYGCCAQTILVFDLDYIDDPPDPSAKLSPDFSVQSKAFTSILQTCNVPWDTKASGCATFFTSRVCAVADFGKGVWNTNAGYGTVVFSQASSGQPTTLQVDVFGAQGGISGSNLGMWHIHQNAVDVSATESICSTAGGVWGQEGNLSGRFGLLDNDDFHRTFTDTNYDVSDLLNKSVVVHGSDGKPSLCATIVATDCSPATSPPEPIYPPQPIYITPQPSYQPIYPQRSYPICATVNLKTPYNDISQGTFTFYQASQGAPTQISFFVVGAMGTVGRSFGEFHIHDFAVNEALQDKCGSLSVGGHYNPTGITNYKACNPSIPTTCEVGDLSGKHGNLANSYERRTNIVDRDLDLATIVGKTGGSSLVIHDGNTNERWVCGTIVDQSSTNPGACDSIP
jgi:hypothetical protein